MDGGGYGRERGGGAQAQRAGAREGSRALGRGVGQGGQGGGLAEAYAAQRLQGAAAEVGGGAHLRLDRPQPKDGQRLREVVRNWRSLRLRGDDASDGEEVGPRVRVSRQSLERLSGNSELAL